MEITLPPHLEQFIAEQVRLGHFRSPAEAICQAVECWQANWQHEDLVRELAQGIEQLDRGAGTSVSGEEIGVFFEGIRAAGRALASSPGSATP
jgi:Arc/MetJ-type ribon-helix-helix transcriptional regulator